MPKSINAVDVRVGMYIPLEIGRANKVVAITHNATTVTLTIDTPTVATAHVLTFAHTDQVGVSWAEPLTHSGVLNEVHKLADAPAYLTDLAQYLEEETGWDTDPLGEYIAAIKALLDGGF